jgi:RNA polymerase sigma-70 factor (ECF subfamily)
MAEIEFEAEMLAERVWLVRLCARLTGHVEAAEDLAQETLLEAWRNRHKFRGGSESRAWLAAIARFVCLRWRRRRWRERAQFVGLPSAETESQPGALSLNQDDGGDFETALNRAELTELLDRAMVLLPAETRALLVQQYVEELPRAEIAARLGLGEGAVAVRLHRGRLALRRILTTNLKVEATALGLVDGAAGEMQETRIWCPKCGTRHLHGQFRSGMEGELLLRCPQCHPEPLPPLAQASLNASMSTVLCGIKGYRPALSRFAAFWHDYLRQGMLCGSVPCMCCGREAPVRTTGTANTDLEFRFPEGFLARCPHCGVVGFGNIEGLMLCSPQAQQFWRTHPRLRTLPIQRLELHGRAAILTRFVSVTGNAAMEIISAADNYQILSHSQTP